MSMKEVIDLANKAKIHMANGETEKAAFAAYEAGEAAFKHKVLLVPVDGFLLCNAFFMGRANAACKARFS